MWLGKRSVLGLTVPVLGPSNRDARSPGEPDPETTVGFYALRLHEAGMITSSPQKIIAQATDWRFLNELKKELKG